MQTGCAGCSLRLGPSQRVTPAACTAVPRAAVRSMPCAPAQHGSRSGFSPWMTLHKVGLDRAHSSLILLSACAFPGHLLCLTWAQRYGVAPRPSQRTPTPSQACSFLLLPRRPLSEGRMGIHALFVQLPYSGPKSLTGKRSGACSP